MKIGGVDPKTLPLEVTLVLPRGDEGVLVFKARGVPDMEEFHKLCPEPVVPTKQTRDGNVPMPEDRNYQSVMTEYRNRRLAYMVVKSLEPSNIEWDTVDLGNPGTWTNWTEDLKNNNLTEVEVNRVGALVLEANCLDETKLKRARDFFLLGPQKVSATSSGQSTEPVTSLSGEPVAA